MRKNCASCRSHLGRITIRPYKLTNILEPPVGADGNPPKRPHGSAVNEEDYMTIYFHYFLQFLKSRMEYRLDFLASIITNMFSTAAGLLFIIFLVDGEVITDLNGWSKEQVLFIYGYSMLAMAAFSLVSINLYNFGNRYVIQGQFDRVLLRPLNTLSQVLFESFNTDSIGSFVVGVAVLSYAVGKLNITLNFLDLCWLFVSVLSAAVILISVFVILSSFAFHFDDRVGITPPVYNLINFSRYPINIFNRIIQFILSWVIPFGFIAFYPATHFLGSSEFQLYCYATPLMALIFLLLAGFFWRLGVGRYTSSGS